MIQEQRAPGLKENWTPTAQLPPNYQLILMLNPGEATARGPVIPSCCAAPPPRAKAWQWPNPPGEPPRSHRPALSWRASEQHRRGKRWPLGALGELHVLGVTRLDVKKVQPTRGVFHHQVDPLGLGALAVGLVGH